MTRLAFLKSAALNVRLVSSEDDSVRMRWTRRSWRVIDPAQAMYINNGILMPVHGCGCEP